MSMPRKPELRLHVDGAHAVVEPEATCRSGSAPTRACRRLHRRARHADRRGLHPQRLDDFEKIRFWTTPVSNCESQGECVPYYRWVSDYIGVIGGR
jgi:hypothetical protein